MNRYKVLIIFLWVFLTPLGPVSAEDRLSGIIDGIRKRYGTLPGLTVTYNREIITRSMMLLGNQMNRDQATGLIHFRPPYNLRIQQETPKSEAIVTDGTTLWWYIPDKKEVFVYPTDKSGRELHLLSDIFQGLIEVNENFVVMLSELDKAGEDELKLIPNPPWPQIEYINLSVTKRNFHIRVVEIHHLLGDITRFTLGNLSPRSSFEEGFFKFVVPPSI